MSEWQKQAHERRSKVVGTAVAWRRAVVKGDPKAPELLKEHEAAIDAFLRGSGGA